jgi:hypothetical protein
VLVQAQPKGSEPFLVALHELVTVGTRATNSGSSREQR